VAAAGRQGSGVRGEGSAGQRDTKCKCATKTKRKQKQTQTQNVGKLSENGSKKKENKSTAGGIYSIKRK